MKKYRLKDAEQSAPRRIHSVHAPYGAWFVPNMTDAELDELRKHHPETFEAYFEEVRPKAEGAKN